MGKEPVLCEWCYEYYIYPEQECEQREGKVCPVCMEYTLPEIGEMID